MIARAVAAAVAAACLLQPTRCPAETTFAATLDGMQNVPPIPGVTATGSALLVLNDAETELSFDIRYSGLSGPEVASHIHNGGPRENGPARFDLPPGAHKVGTWAIPADMVAELFAGRLYINVHTDLYILGEIRGNIAQQALATEARTWGQIKQLYE